MPKFALDLGTRKQVDISLLTHPSIPKSLWGLNPRTLMGQEVWDRTRIVAFQKNGFYCRACGIHTSAAWKHTWLEGHETYTYDTKEKVARIDKVVGLCHRCHMFIHAGSMRNNPEHTADDIEYIIRTGFELLARADLVHQANAESQLTLAVYDSDLYEDLYGDEPLSRYALPQSGWVLSWDGYLWKRLMERTYVKPDRPDAKWKMARINEEGAFYYESD